MTKLKNGILIVHEDKPEAKRNYENLCHFLKDSKLNLEIPAASKIEGKKFDLVTKYYTAELELFVASFDFLSTFPTEKLSQIDALLLISNSQNDVEKALLKFNENRPNVLVLVSENSLLQDFCINKGIELVEPHENSENGLNCIIDAFEANVWDGLLPSNQQETQVIQSASCFNEEDEVEKLFDKFTSAGDDEEVDFDSLIDKLKQIRGSFYSVLRFSQVQVWGR
jgi:hypothetical protein